MKILYEDTIPFGAEYLTECGQVQAYSWQTLTPDDIENADIMAVRSTTKITPELLVQANKLSLVTTATAGTNHFDKAYLDQQHITWKSAGGCNAVAVAEYVLSTIVLAHQAGKLDVTSCKVGIVGAGHVGTALSRLLKTAGIAYVLCDPPLQQQGDKRPMVTLSDALKCDVVTLHVPYIKGGAFPTQNLLDTARLNSLNTNQLLINACRGEVIDEQALLALCKRKAHPTLVLDVFDNEPNINTELLRYCWLVTQHIAGHSVEGKVRGTQMVYEQICEKVGITPTKVLADFIAPPKPISLTLSEPMALQLSPADLAKVILSVYNVSLDDEAFRNKLGDTASSTGDVFSHARKHYRVRRECNAYTLHIDDKMSSTIRQQLISFGFTLVTQ